MLPGAIAAVGISRNYGAVTAIADASFEIREGITVLLGRNGAGKSTLFRILAGAEQPSAGRVIRYGTPLDTPAAWRSHKRDTGWLPQSTPLISGLSVGQYLAYSAWLKEVPRADLGTSVTNALEAVGLTEHHDRPLTDLSGGQQRRAGIAQALVHAPRFLLLDEPSAGLDPLQRSTFHRLMHRLSQDRTVFLSTHLLEDVAAVGQRTIVMEQGSIAFSGTMEELAAFGEGDLTSRLRTGFVKVTGHLDAQA